MHSIFVRHTHSQLLSTAGLLRSRGAGLPVGGRRERISWPTAIAYEQWSPDDAVVHHLYHVPQPLMPPLLYPSSCRRRLLAQPDPASSPHAPAPEALSVLSALITLHAWKMEVISGERRTRTSERDDVPSSSLASVRRGVVGDWLVTLAGGGT